MDLRRPHLGREEELRARHARLGDRLADRRLVAVELGAVEEAVSKLQGAGDTVGRVDCLRLSCARCDGARRARARRGK